MTLEFHIFFPSETPTFLYIARQSPANLFRTTGNAFLAPMDKTAGGYRRPFCSYSGFGNVGGFLRKRRQSGEILVL